MSRVSRLVSCLVVCVLSCGLDSCLFPGLASRIRLVFCLVRRFGSASCLVLRLVCCICCIVSRFSILISPRVLFRDLPRLASPRVLSRVLSRLISCLVFCLESCLESYLASCLVSSLVSSLVSLRVLSRVFSRMSRLVSCLEQFSCVFVRVLSCVSSCVFGRLLFRDLSHVSLVLLPVLQSRGKVNNRLIYFEERCMSSK